MSDTRDPRGPDHMGNPRSCVAANEMRVFWRGAGELPWPALRPSALHSARLETGHFLVPDQ
jgi:hypothetical protein